MAENQLPSYAVFDDYRDNGRIFVIVRWFLIAVWFTLHNYRPQSSEDYWVLNLMVLSLAAINGYVHWRIRTGRSVHWRLILSVSASDLVIITAGIIITSGFHNPFFVMYYPALLALSLVAFSWRLSFGVTAVVAAVYSGLSFYLPDGPDFDDMEEKVLIARVAAMIAVIAAGNLMIGVERRRRREAVDAERTRAAENLSLQRKAQEAELAAQEERSRIAREIHDGIAQSIYGLSLNLETCADLAERGEVGLRDQLRRLVPLAKQTLLETRHYIFDLKPLLAGERDLKSMAESQVKEFRMVAGTPVTLSTEGQTRDVPLPVASGLYRILQESLYNVLKHASASQVSVLLQFEPEAVKLRVQDDGVGFRSDDLGPGFGLDNMRYRAEELRGSFEISGAPGRGTTIGVTLPATGGEA